MIKYMNRYHNRFEVELNKDLMTKAADGPLVNYIHDVWRSLEIAPPIKILKFEYTDTESEIDINDHIFKRDKRVKKADKKPHKYIEDSRCGQLTTHVQISLPVKNTKTGVTEIHKKIIKKSMLIPLMDSEGYLHINGNKYHMIYQLVEKSTYVGNQTVTLKSLMPIALKRRNTDQVGLDISETVLGETMVLEDGSFARKAQIIKPDTHGVLYTLPVYNIFMFKKEIPAIIFYLANGADWALDFLGVSKILSFETVLDEYAKNEIWFQISSKCYLRVNNKELFMKYPYIQSIAGALLQVCTNRSTPELINTKEMWIKKLGGDNVANMNKGYDMLIFFNRLLDETTKKILLIDDYNKKDIYSLIRWIMMNFNKLRLKDNMNLMNKRIRCNEYIASLLTIEFSRRLNRVISMGNKATIDNYREIFRFSGDMLIKKMHKSGVLRFDMNINDMTFFSKFKVTLKGPHSLGNKDGNRISAKLRGLHPSMLGYVDILVCGNSDPGTSTLLSPWTRMKDFYFDSTIEEDTFLYEFKNDIDSLGEESGLRITANSKEEYLETMSKLADFNTDIQVFGLSSNKSVIILDEEVLDSNKNK